MERSLSNKVSEIPLHVDVLARRFSPRLLRRGSHITGVEALGWGKFQWQLLFQTGCCWAADSMEMMLLSFIVPMIAEQWNLTGVQKCMISVATFIGIMIGNEVQQRLLHTKRCLATPTLCLAAAVGCAE